MKEDDLKEQQTELEKETIPVPEVTVSAAMKKAHRIARRLRASGRSRLTADEVLILKDDADELNQIIEDAPILVDIPVIEVCGDCEETADNFDNFMYACNDALNENVTSRKREASEALCRLAEKVESCGSDVDMKKVKAHVNRILAYAGVNEIDFRKNRQEQKNNVNRGINKENRSLRILLNQKNDSGKSLYDELGVSNSTKLVDLTLGKLIAIVNLIKNPAFNPYK